MLQVDDNMVNRRVATSMLSRYGATVISSNSGLEAVVAVKNQQAGMEYDLILMDIQMPEVNFFCNLKNKTCFVYAHKVHVSIVVVDTQLLSL
jgi:CheY-like chemotaxis protein